MPTSTMLQTMTGQIPTATLSSNWRQQLREAITDLDDLLDAVGLTRQDVKICEAASTDFALKVPQDFVRRMQRGDPHDPLLLQVLPLVDEMHGMPGYTTDPVGEQGTTNPKPGIVHKYHGRALLIVAGSCAVNCRYCFRRHFPYSDNRNSRAQWRDTLDYIRADSSIVEVILSGGDPLVAGSDQLSELIDNIAAIDHIRRLRIHSRLPVVLPDRITPHLLDALSRPSLTTVMVIHANHANEIDENVARAVAAMRRANILTLNQTVLLAGINDSVEAQADLSQTLFDAGVLPYYLHMLDKVQGAAHFAISEDAAIALHRQMRDCLPGYLLPRLVREVEGAGAKIGIA